MGEGAEILKERSLRMFAHIDTLLDGICLDIGVVETNNSLIVVAIAVNVTAQ